MKLIHIHFYTNYSNNNSNNITDYDNNKIENQKIYRHTRTHTQTWIYMTQ